MTGHEHLTIGFWFGRKHQKLHLCESVIADRLIARCGRQMDSETWSGGKLNAGGNQPRCKQCDSERRA